MTTEHTARDNTGRTSDTLSRSCDTPRAPRDNQRTDRAHQPATTHRGHLMNDTAATADRLLQAPDCEALTGIPASTWRYWAHIGDSTKPASFKLGRRRVWRMSTVLAWIEAQEAAASREGVA